MLKFSNPNIRERMAYLLEEIVVSVSSEMMPNAGSPIERAMFEAMVAFFYVMTGKLPNVAKQDAFPSDGHWKITPQAQIESFRVDFLIECSMTGAKVVVECDGHNFHERTKAQARNDRSRDRDLQALGYLILRYTGSEIFADPWACAFDIWMKIIATEKRQAA